MFTHPEASQTLSVRGFRRLHFTGMVESITGHWWLIQSPAPLPSQRSGDGTESSSLLITSLAPRATCRPSLVLSQSHLINITYDSFLPFIIRKTQWFSEVWARNGDGDQTHISYYTSQDHKHKSLILQHRLLFRTGGDIQNGSLSYFLIQQMRKFEIKIEMNLARPLTGGVVEIRAED